MDLLLGVLNYLFFVFIPEDSKNELEFIWSSHAIFFMKLMAKSIQEAI